MKVACCFLEYDDKILIVARTNPSNQEIEWDIPADKVNSPKGNEDTVKRVVAEEAGYEISSSKPELIGTFKFISGKNEPYTMYAYRLKIDKLFSANLGTLKSTWVSPKECVNKYNLIKNFFSLLNLAGYIN